MMATRQTKSALVKSRMDQLEYRLKQFESLAADMRAEIDDLASLIKPTDEAPLIPAFLAPHDPIEARPRLQHAKPTVRRAPMPPPTKRARRFNAETLEQVRQWIEQGHTRDEIADRLGTSLGSLQVTCSRHGISLWRRSRARAVQEDCEI